MLPYVSSFVLFLQFAHILLTCAIGIGGSGEGTAPIVRRASNEPLQSIYNSQHAEIDVHGRLKTGPPHRRNAEQAKDVDVASILRKAELSANDPSMQVHLSPQDRQRLGLHPDLELPRRDSLLQARAALLRQMHNSTSALPLSLLQEASIKKHEGGMSAAASKPPDSHTLQDAASSSRFQLPQSSRPNKIDGVEVPEWVPRDAFAEDGSLIMDRVLYSKPDRKHKRPAWTRAGSSYQDSSAAAFESEMARLGREDEVEDSLVAMEMDANSEEEPGPDPAHKKNSFKFYKFTPVKLRHIQSADMVQMAELRVWSYGFEIPLAKSALAWNEMGRSPPGHNVMMVSDNNWQTVWQDVHMGSIMLVFGDPFTMTNFMFITSKDNPQDDPVQWLFEGTNDAVKGPWTMLHAQLSDGNVPPQRTAQTEMFSWKVDCELSEWHDWSECSENCSGGNRTRIRKILRHSWNNGHCDHIFDQLGYCNEQPCEKVIIKAGAPRGMSFDGVKALLLVSIALVAGSWIIDV